MNVFIRIVLVYVSVASEFQYHVLKKRNFQICFVLELYRAFVIHVPAAEHCHFTLINDSYIKQISVCTLTSCPSLHYYTGAVSTGAGTACCCCCGRGGMYEVQHLGSVASFSNMSAFFFRSFKTKLDVRCW